MRKSSSWQALEQISLQNKSRAIIGSVADKLKVPADTQELSAQTFPSSPERGRWLPFDVASGDASLALFYGQLDRSFPGQSWDQTAHLYLERAVQSLNEQSSGPVPGPGLLGGLAGLCFVTRYLSRNGARYRRLQANLDTILVEHTNALLDAEPLVQPDFQAYDLVTGPTGIGIYLLASQAESDAARLTLARVIERLLFFCSRTKNGLGFFIPASSMPTERHRQQNPYGATDCGLAHGVAGPLTLLSLAYLQGIKSNGLIEGVRNISDWLLAHQQRDEWGTLWPTMAPPDNLPAERHTRASWCYGAPGIARALLFAGLALEDRCLRDMAIETMLSVLRRPVQLRAIPSPILCHGVAGLLQIVLRFANDTNNPFFFEAAAGLTEQLLEMFDPRSPVGFRDLDSSGREFDDPGFLNGAVGVALALLAASSALEPEWDRLLLLS